MTIAPALIALRESGIDLRGGDAVYVAWCHQLAHEDPPVLAAVRNDAAAEVAKIVGCGPEQVTVVEFSPDTLLDVVRRHQRLEDPGFPSLPDYLERTWAIVAYWTDLIGTRDRTFPADTTHDALDRWRNAAVEELRGDAIAAGIPLEAVTGTIRMSDPELDGSRTFTIEAHRTRPPKETP